MPLFAVGVCNCWRCCCDCCCVRGSARAKRGSRTRLGSMVRAIGLKSSQDPFTPVFIEGHLSSISNIYGLLPDPTVSRASSTDNCAQGLVRRVDTDSTLNHLPIETYYVEINSPLERKLCELTTQRTGKPSLASLLTVVVVSTQTLAK